MVSTISTDIAVSGPRPLADRILDEVRRAPDCELDALALSLPELPWQDIVREVHRLSGMGQLQRSPWAGGIYTVRAASEVNHSLGECWSGR